MAGKTGTARRTALNAGYTAGNYTASFVGIFPADDPQYVVLVKLDSPGGSRYAGGEVAAPVTRIVLRAALAARDAALDRESLLASGVRDSSVERIPDTSTTSAAVPAVDRTPVSSYIVSLPLGAKPRPVPTTPGVVPDVRGLTLRGAVRALHSAGFRVRLVNASASTTTPAAGTVAPPGSVVQLGRTRE